MLHRFIDLLLQSGLVTRDEISKIRSQLAKSETSDDAATDDYILNQLADSGHLTDFQATTVRAGKSDELVLDDYLIIDEIGRGGMGRVYKARHTVMQREVAVKFTIADDSNQEAEDRFRREVEALSKLVHPNIVSALDAGYRNDRCYLVMEYVQGTDLASHIREHGAMSFEDALSVIIQAAEGLQYVHRHNIIHRDIKPSNLLLTPDRTVKLLDVGLARYGEPIHSASADADKTDSDLTQPGQIVGTVDYMAPEQAIMSREVTPAADIYSLGCTLFFLLTREPPFPKRGQPILARIIAHREMAIPLLSQRCQDVPTEFDPIFTKLLAKRPEKRYTDAAELLVDLKRIQRDYGSIFSKEATVVADYDESRRTRTKTRRRIALGLTLIAAISGAYFLTRPAGHNPPALAGPVLSSGQAISIAQPPLPLDLMSYVDVRANAVSGVNWQFAEGLLTVPDSSPSKLLIPVSVDQNYRLHLTVRRKSGEGPLVLFLPIASQSQCFLLIDSRRNSKSSSGLGFNDAGRLAITAEKSLNLESQRPVQLRVDVSQDGVNCFFNETPLFQWAGDPSELRLASGWSASSEPAFVIGSNHQASFEVSRLYLEPLETEAE